MKQKTTPNEVCKVLKATDTCAQCQQHHRALDLCSRFERAIPNHRGLQHLLASQDYWLRSDLVTVMLKDPTIEAIVNEWDNNLQAFP
jgi:hypothetical protein